MKVRFTLFILLIFSCFAYSQSASYSLAENYFRNSEYEKATQLFEGLVKKSPYNVTYLERLITCYQETNKFEVAKELLSKKLEKKPQLIFLNVMIGQNYERKQDVVSAEKYYKKAINSITKKSYRYGPNVANLFKTYNKLDLAIQAYKKAEEVNKNAHYGFQIAQIHGEQGDFELMFEEYINYLDRNDDYLNTVKRYTSKYVTDDGENERNILFKKALLRKSASNPKDVWNDLLSWLFIKQKDYSKALIQARALYQRDNDKLSLIFQLGEIAFENEAYSVAKQCFDFTIEKTSYPQDKFDAILMNLEIAIATKEENIDEKFNAIFEEFGVNRNTFSIQVAYADYLTFTKNQPEEAKKVLEKALEFSENKYQKARVKLKLADVLVYQNTFNKALIYFSQVQTQFKNHELGQQARFKVAQTSYFKNDFKWAKAQLKVLKGSASQLIANDAADLFLTISDNEPKDSIPSGLVKYAQADLLSFQNKTSEAISILSEVLIKFKGQSIEDEALFKQAELFKKEQKFEEAISNYEQIIALNAEGILVDDAHYQLAGIYEQQEAIEKAQEHYQKIIFDYPSSIYLVDARKKYRKLRGDSI